MKNILNLIYYWLGWIAYFCLFKILFLGYHYDKTQALSIKEIAGVFIHGLKLDISFASYIALIAGVVITISLLIPKLEVVKVLKYYTSIILVIVSLIIFTDLEIFNAWGFRIDGTIFKYFNSPKEMFASIWASPVIILTILWLVLYEVCRRFYFNFLINRFINVFERKIISITLGFIFTACLIIPLRGGLQQIPINPSAVYFSSNYFANISAVNPCWNLFYSITEKNYKTDNPYLFMDAKKALELVKSSNYQDETKHYDIIKNNTPNKTNVLLIIVESFSSKFIEFQGGPKGCTPNFDKLIKEGVFFDNCYSSGDRSDKGLVALLSGYPSQPTTSIIFDNKKSMHLPCLARDFSNQKYITSYYYGGEMEFANLQSFTLSGGFQNIVSIDDFDKKHRNSKWGVHDHIVFNRLFEDLNKNRVPFFSTIFTLSNHEPFEIPISPKFKGNDIQTLFLNSAWYTDKSIGDFIDKAKKTEWWQNTLVIITADHGHRMPGDSPNHDAQKFHVPMLWLGGALNIKDTVIQQVCSQTDLASSLLHQLNMKSSDYQFSRDLFNTSYKPFAFYSYNDGFGYINDKGKIYYDNVGKACINSDEAKQLPELIKQGKAYLQVLFTDYLNK